jgi:hypothetical protein
MERLQILKRNFWLERHRYFFPLFFYSKAKFKRKYLFKAFKELNLNSLNNTVSSKNLYYCVFKSTYHQYTRPLEKMCNNRSLLERPQHLHNLYYHTTPLWTHSVQNRRQVPQPMEIKLGINVINSCLKHGSWCFLLSTKDFMLPEVWAYSRALSVRPLFLSVT